MEIKIFIKSINHFNCQNELAYFEINHKTTFQYKKNKSSLNSIKWFLLLNC